MAIVAGQHNQTHTHTHTHNHHPVFYGSFTWMAGRKKQKKNDKQIKVSLPNFLLLFEWVLRLVSFVPLSPIKPVKSGFWMGIRKEHDRTGYWRRKSDCSKIFLLDTVKLNKNWNIFLRNELSVPLADKFTGYQNVGCLFVYLPINLFFF